MKNMSLFSFCLILFLSFSACEKPPVKFEGKYVSIDNIKWATCNVETPGTFVAQPQDLGMLYQWNRNIGWSTTNPMENSAGGNAWNSSNAVGNFWKRTNDPCPPGWRVPTKEECQRLAEKAKNIKQTTLNDTKGLMFTNDIGETLFLPATGYRNYNNGTLGNLDTNGYWSSTVNLSNNAFLMLFGSNLDTVVNGSGIRANGFSVRCVADE